MTNLLLRVLAFFLLIGAIAVAVIGYRLSTRSDAVQSAPATEPVVRAAVSVRAGQAIRASDMIVERAASRPAGSFSAPDQVVGQVAGADIAAGMVLTRAHFQIESHLLRGLHAGERAVAIKVDDVAGLGGLARPGDRVDVLLYLRGIKETGDTTSAQVVLADVRLLAYGEAVQRSPMEEESALPVKTGKVSGKSSRSPNSAVLAVPEAAASKLMLAANSGNLRLSLRPLAATTAPAATAVKTDHVATFAAPRHLVRLGDLLPNKESGAVAAPHKDAVAVQPRIAIHEGDIVRSVGRPPR